jgi:uncharacterized protein (TIGR03437 family)
VVRISVKNHIAFILLSGIAALAQTGTLTIKPSPVVMCGKTGQVISAIPVNASSSSGPVTAVVAGIVSDGNWLTVDPSFASITTEAKPQFALGVANGVIPFANGTYNAQVLLAAPDGTSLGTIPVLLQVTASGCTATNARTGELFTDSGPVMIQLPPGAASGVQLNIYNLSAANVTIVPSVSANWLSVLNTNFNVISGLMYPTPLGVGVSTAKLSAGTYTGNVQIQTSNSNSLNVPVTLNVVSGTPALAASPSPLAVGIPAGVPTSTSAVQLTNLSSSPASLDISSDHAWLSVNPATATIPANSTVSLGVSVNTSSLARGTNSGNVIVRTNTGSFLIPVTANAGIASSLTATPDPLSFSASGATITVSAAFGPVSFSATAFSSVNQPWLSVSPFSTSTSPGNPAVLKVIVNPSMLPAGPAIASITLTPGDGSAALTIPVYANAGKDASLTVSPPQLTLTSAQTQTLTLNSTSPAIYSVQVSGASWLSARPPMVSAPAAVNVQANVNGLTPGTYTAQIIFTNAATGAQQTVPVTLTIAPLTFMAAPSTLNFTYESGSPIMPAAQTVQVTSSVIAPFTVTAPDFLSVTPSASTTPATISVKPNPAALANLPPGLHTGILTVGNQNVSVTLTVQPHIASVVNAASLIPGPIAPGELVTIFAAGGGTMTAAFDGIPSPVLYADANQINTVVPYEITGRSQVQVQVFTNDASSVAVPMQVVDTAPAIFPASLPNNPVSAGNILQIFATGEGIFPGAITGAITSLEPPFPQPSQPVSLTIGGQPAQILYAGEAPGLISGLLQVNAIIPDNLATGPQPLTLTVGDHSNSAQALTITMQ